MRLPTWLKAIGRSLGVNRAPGLVELLKLIDASMTIHPDRWAYSGAQNGVHRERIRNAKDGIAVDIWAWSWRWTEAVVTTSHSSVNLPRWARKELRLYVMNLSHRKGSDYVRDTING